MKALRALKKLWKEAPPGEPVVAPRPGNRRGERLLVSVPVVVYGWNEDQSSFLEITRTLCINAHGGLVVLEARVDRGQTILLINQSEEEQQCRVVYVGCGLDGQRKIGLEFTRPAPDFWGLRYDPQRKAWQSVEPPRTP